MTLPVSLADVEAAADRIKPFVHRDTGIHVGDTRPRTRGTRLLQGRESPEGRSIQGARRNERGSRSFLPTTTGVVTHSSGNHGQAVAYAASIRDLPAWVVMPRTAPALKMDAVRSYGAEVVLCDHADRESTAAEVMERTGAVLVHPFDDSAVIAGQGTATLELVDQVPNLDVIVAPIGGGGLLSGAATVAGGHEPTIPVVGAEPFAVDDAYRSLTIRHSTTRRRVAGDGRRRPPHRNRSPRVHHPDGARSRGDSRHGGGHSRGGILPAPPDEAGVEPSGATPLAAIRTEPERFRDRRVGVIISGGNTDFSWLGAAEALTSPRETSP